MAINLVANKSDPPIAALVVANLVRSNVCVSVTWGSKTAMSLSHIALDTPANICRYLARISPDTVLYGNDSLQRTEIDHWLVFGYNHLASPDTFNQAIWKLNQGLGPATYLVGNHLTLADVCTWGTLYKSKQWINLMTSDNPPVNVVRWYKFIDSLDVVKPLVSTLPELSQLPGSLHNRGVSVPKEKSPKPRESGKGKDDASKTKDEGKFIELPGAEKGKVVVRFPPEASGYLHIGHAKAALLNQYYKDAYDGKLIMRFDDTNPAKEKVDFEKVILEDLELLKITADEFTHTSNYFEMMLGMCEKLLKEGLAYVDDTDAETMKQEREQRIESKNRNNSVEQNLKMWSEMKVGSEAGQKCCVRAKIDMNSANGCMRDPTIYRCKNEPHPRTGNKYKVYPTYDFACPIVDSIEGVTHCLRTMEYHDRDEQFYWFIDVLGLRKPHIWEYSRLNMMNTVLSKRKLTWFVDEGLVDGWDDPRFPTVRGVLRRGMTVEGLKQFIIAQGSSRSVVLMEWDKIWAFNKKIIDPIAPRYTALSPDNVPVLVKGATLQSLEVPIHPKDPNIGKKVIWVGPRVLIDREDADILKEGENATFINWGNLLIKKINRNNGRVESVEAELNLQNTDYKKTPKLTWLAETDKAKFVPCIGLFFDHIISKAVLGKDEDFKNFINKDTRQEINFLGDPELLKVKKGEIIQLQRRGFFICDREYAAPSSYSGRENPITLIFIPDGKAKEQATSGAPKKSESVVSSGVSQSTPVVSKKQDSVAEINNNIIAQGDLVRKLKSEKADKETIGKEVAVLLKLKADFKSATGTDWKPGVSLPTSSSEASSAKSAAPAVQTVASPSSVISSPSLTVESVLSKIAEQGDKVRNLKSQKAAKDVIDAEVKTLLGLKADFKTLTGVDWKPGVTPPSGLKTDSTPSVATKPESEVNSLNSKIVSQGDKVRALKSQKAEKSVIDEEVKTLLGLKAEFKTLTGNDWKPGVIPPAGPKTDSTPSIASKSGSEVDSLNSKIVAQGDKVRVLKSQKAEKSVIDEEVKALLALKADFKTLSGVDWKPGMTLPNAPLSSSTPSAASKSENEVEALNNKIVAQGDKVRALKSQKAEKSVIDAEVKILLLLKTDFKNCTGLDWKPGMTLPSGSSSEPACTVASSSGTEVEELDRKIVAQGDKVRELKSQKAEKSVIDKEVQLLLSLKAAYQKASGQDWKPKTGQTGARPSPPKTQSPAPPKAKAEKAKQPAKAKEKTPSSDDSSKKQTRLGLEATKEDNLPEWYSQVITKGELIEYYDVSGCYIYRPWSYAIWEFIKDFFDCEIKKLGVQNCYFPLFVSRSVLEKEKTHIADFAPEVAWVTKSGDSDLAEPIAVRPTSETVMYPAYAKWIQSYRDLPIKLNQWNNVVRWEFKHPQPFLRTREFLWQEGHTAYAVQKEATDEVLTILDLYARIYTDLLAIPVIKGRKTEKEKFAGGDYTTTVEAFISASGRAIQGATSHHLGQNFSKMFEITYEDPETQEKKFVYQNSWGITTRTIGVMIMVHADNQGLVLPPRVASIQVVIVPCGITAALKNEDRLALQSSCTALETELREGGMRVYGDYRENYSPGWRFNHWELKGVPVRVELGPKDLAKQQIVAVRRDTGEKITLPRKTAVKDVFDLLGKIQSNLLSRAEQDLKSHTVICKNWNEFCKKLDEKNIILAPFCGAIDCEEHIKKESARDDAEVDAGAPAMGAKSLCSPFDQPTAISASDKCINPTCKNKPLQYTLFGRSY